MVHLNTPLFPRQVAAAITQCRLLIFTETFSHSMGRNRAILTDPRNFTPAHNSFLVVVVVVVVGVALATVPIKGTANVFCAVVDEQVNIADREEPMPL